MALPPLTGIYTPSLNEYRHAIAQTQSQETIEPSIAPKNDQCVDLTPFLNQPLQAAIKDGGCLPIFIDCSKSDLNNIYQTFQPNERLDAICQTTKDWGEEFASSKEGNLWTNYRFGVFNQSQPTHKKRRLIEGMSCKITREYCDFIRNTHAELLATFPYVDLLFQQLMRLEEIAQAIFTAKIKEIAVTHPAINQLFYPYNNKQRLAITMRIIRFDKTENFCLPLHHDISILSLIFPSDDDPSNECLLIAPTHPTVFNLDQLRRIIRPVSPHPEQTCAFLITGSLLSHLGIPIPATPHAVLPHDRDFRYVITACCHVPNLNTSNLNSVLNDMKDLPESFINKFLHEKKGNKNEHQ